jgi:hypothetical protein
MSRRLLGTLAGTEGIVVIVVIVVLSEDSAPRLNFYSNFAAANAASRSPSLLSTQRSAGEIF